MVRQNKKNSGSSFLFAFLKTRRSGHAMHPFYLFIDVFPFVATGNKVIAIIIQSL